MLSLRPTQSVERHFSASKRPTRSSTRLLDSDPFLRGTPAGGTGAVSCSSGFSQFLNGQLAIYKNLIPACMKLSCSIAVLIFMLSAGFFSSLANAVPPWLDFANPQRVAAQPDKAYRLSKEQGPWMIMAMTYRGPNAQKEAQQLVYELRKHHQLETYTHLETYDYSQAFVGRGVDKFGKPRRMRHQQNDEIREVGVLAGNYSSVDDPRAQRDLKRIKSLTLESLESEADKTSRTFAELRNFHRDLLKKNRKSKDSSGPMRLAFITTNPLLPDEYFHPQGIDHFVAKLNKGVKHSLLECPEKYTVKVATFSGLVAINPAHIKEIEKSDFKSSRLEEGALKAHRLSVALRAKGYEAYQFHDRRSSIVTVGAFNNAPDKSPGGTLVYEPQVRELIYRFGAKQKASQVPRGQKQIGVQAGIVPEQLLGIPFDVHPTLIPVPKRSVSSDFSRRTLSVR